MLRHFRIPRYLLLLTLLSTLHLSCGDKRTTKVIVSVAAPNEVVALKVSATLDGRKSQNEMTIDQYLQQFVVELPDTGGTTLGLVIQGLDRKSNEACFVEKSITIALSDEPVLTTKVELPASLLCTLTLAPQGSGEISLDGLSPTGVDLGNKICTQACTYTYDKGTTLRIRPFPDGRSYVDEKQEGSLSCDGNSPCTLPSVVLDRSIKRTILSKKECSANGDGGWCREVLPVAVQGALRGVWGSASDDIWVAGHVGSILRWNGATWRSQADLLPPEHRTRNFYRIWGSSPRDVWFIGDSGVVLRFDGTKFVDMKQPRPHALYAIWGSGRGDVWVTGDGGTIITWDGSKWVDRSTGDLRNKFPGVYGDAPDSVYVVGGTPEVGYLFLRWDGTALNRLAQDGLVRIGLWGSGPGDIWSVGVRQQKDGVPVNYPASAHPVDIPEDLGLPAADDLTERVLPVAIGGLRRNLLFAVGGTTSLFNGQVTLSGSKGVILRYDGTRWALEKFPGAQNNLIDVFAAPWGEVLAVGTSGIIVRRPPQRSFKNVGTFGAGALKSVHGSKTGVWIAGEGGVLRNLEGGNEKKFDDVTTASLTSIFQGTDSHIFAVGKSGEIRHFDGTTWSKENPAALNGDFLGVWAHSADRALAVVDSFVFRRSMGMWSLHHSANPESVNLTGIWGRVEDNRYFACGEDGSVHQGSLDAMGGNVVYRAANLSFTTLSGESRAGGDIWVAGHKGAVITGVERGGNVSWRNVPIYNRGTLFDQTFYGISVAPGDTWLVGEGGAVFHSNGNGFGRVASGTKETLWGVYVAAPDDVWLVGDKGLLLRYSP